MDGGKTALAVGLLGDLADGLELPLAFIRAIETLKKERDFGKELSDDDRRVLWAAEQGLRQVEAVRLVVGADSLTPEPVAVRGVVEEVQVEFGQFWRLVGEEPRPKMPREQLLVDVNRQVLRCFLMTLLTESLQFTIMGQVFAKRVRGKIMVGVRDFGPALPRGVNLTSGQTLPLRPKSRVAFGVINELVRVMQTSLQATRHRDGVSFFVLLPESRQARLW
ncbi:MAG: hypothetical protein LBM12_03305 [Candidatus Nomurabacteria bacterium]|jgi:hypothetical protein|nr:hypothetical protein [Candidatus Nomurabacteria bacterium]